MPNTAKYPLLRRSFVVLGFLGLVGLFFALNLFLYIPRQQQSYNKKVFRILKEIAQDFDKTIEGNATTKLKNLNKDKVAKSLGNLVITDNGYTDALLHRELMASFKKLEKTKDNSDSFRRVYRFAKDTIHVDLIDTTASKDSIVHVTFPIDSVLNPNIQNLHNSLFHLVMLVKKISLEPLKNDKPITKDAILYKRGRLAASYHFNGDSLFKNKQYGQFSTVNDLDIEGAGYKAFSLPFQVGNEELMLIGFLPQKSYLGETTRYSKPALLWIGAFLILILLSLPVAKILMSGKKERISINETRMLIVVFVTMPFLVILTAGTVMVYKYAGAMYGNTLTEMHRDVQEKFKNEVDTALQQLKHYDYLTMGIGTRSALTFSNRQSDFLQQAKSDAKDIIYYPRIYLNVDDIYWLDSTGQQIAKWFFLQQLPTYLDLSERNFFKRMRDDKAFRRKAGIEEDAFFVEPTISWASGEYVINIVTKSKTSFYTKALLIGMASRMYSVCNPVVPKDYNFCIVDRKGLILFHSETKRSLHENLLEESNYNPELAAALGSKDSVEISDMHLFDRDVKMIVEPVEDMPGYYIASYYNKRAQNLFVFHCAAFAFLCTSGTLLVLLLFHLLKSLTLRTSQGNDAFRYETEWMRPSEQKETFYNKILKQQFGITLLLVLGYMVCRARDWQPENFLIHACVLLPFFITINYLLLKKWFDHKIAGNNDTPAQQEWKKQRIILPVFYAVVIIALWVLLLQLLHAAITPAAADWMALSMAVAVPLLPFRNIPLPGPITRWFKNAYLGKYLASLLFCIALIAVVPTIGFMSYAIQQENIIKTKSEQIAAAKKIESRRLKLNTYFKTTKINKGDAQYMLERKLYPKYGIYLPNQNLGASSNALLTKEDSNHLSKNAHFYKAATRFLFLPRDHADFFNNNQYYYWLKTPRLKLTYINQTDQLTPHSIYLQAVADTDFSVFRLFRDLFALLLLLGIALFLVFHYRLLRSIAKKVFLIDFITEKSVKLQNKKWPDAFYKGLRFSRQEMEWYHRNTPCINQQAITRIEQKIKQENRKDNTPLLHLQHSLAGAYYAMWQTLSDEQKYVLYDFATDGFTNYRNIDVVYQLFLKGLIICRTDGHLEIMSYSFRSYLLGKAASEEIVELQQKNASHSIWKSTRNILYALFFATMIFLFATQQDVSNKIIAIVSGLATIVPLLIRLFDRNVPGTAAGKS